MGARRATVLDIWMNGQRVGEWERARGGADRLTYAAEWMDSPEGRPLSLSLPFARGHGIGGIVPLRSNAIAAYFENLIPDNDRILERLRARSGAASTQAFDLLAAIGRDCAGAVQLVPSGEPPGDVRTIQAEALSEADVAQWLRQTVTTGPFAAGNAEVFRISLAGAQEKTALLLHQGQWCRPLGATPTTHILKLPLGVVGNMQADMKDSVELEWLCMEIARDVGLPVASVAIGQFEDQKVLIVERFDRRLSTDGTWWQRLPQEDLCQATGTPPNRKYEADGGPGIRQMMELLRNSERATIDRVTFFETQVLFWLIAATDGHAKNFSLQLLPGGRFQLTPLYDILSTYPIQGRQKNQLDPRVATLAMAVESKNRHYKIAEIQGRHWMAMAESLGLEADIRELLTRLIERTRTAIQSVSERIPAGFPRRVCDTVFEGTRQACTRLEATIEHTALRKRTD